MDWKLNGVESSRPTGLIDSLIEIAEAGKRKQFLCYVVLNP